MSDELKHEPPSNIIALNADAEKELEIRLRVQAGKLACPGQHKNIEVDSVERILICKNCDFVVDAFDYVEQWALEGERRMSGLKGIEYQRKIAQAEHDDLKRKVENLRAQLKRGGQPQSVEERREYDSQRLNPPRANHKFEILKKE